MTQVPDADRIPDFERLLSEIRDGFTRTNERLDALEQRLSVIEAELRRINPNGNR